MSQHEHAVINMPLKWGSGEIEVSGVALFDTDETPFFFDFIVCDCSLERPTQQDLAQVEEQMFQELNTCKDLISELKQKYA